MRSSRLPRNLRRIVIRVPNWIGDAVMATPAMSAIRSAYPEAEIALIANPVVAELLSGHPCCDRVIVLDKKREHGGLRGIFRFSALLRKERFDGAFLLQNAVEAAIIARAAGIPIRVGYRTDGRGFLLTHGLSPSVSKGLHHTQYYLRMVRHFGIGEGEWRPTLTCTDRELAFADELLAGRNWAVINPGAAYGSAKRWYPERFAVVANLIFREFNLNPLLIGSPGEAEIGVRIEKCVETDVLNLIGKTSVREMMAVIARSSLMITNDSGPMHVAAALQVPVVALFGPTDPAATSPASTRSRVVRKPVECSPCLKRGCPTDHRCMETIEPHDVVMEARALLRSDRETPAENLT